ncbi:dihydrolipoamide acetyltransferase [Tissierella simiarum]|uniref:dihydrolipoamide acetyltransferase n=1 Tax=Tissierella simiarum TaxID=2841534 RepID=UPI0031BB3836
MITEVIMPKAGMDMQEGTIVKWMKKEGEYVEQGEVLLEIITDKVNMEVEAETSGYLLKILRNAGEKVPVITTIGYLGEKDDKVPEGEGTPDIAEDSKKEENEEVAKTLYKEEIRTVSIDKVRATPVARRIAREKGIDLFNIKGSGPKGRIQKIDVENYKENELKVTPLARRIAEIEGVDINTVAGSGLAGKVTKEDVMKALGKEEIKETKEEKVEEENTKVIPMSNMRKIIAQRMSESYFTAPTFTLNMEVDMEKSLELRKEVKDHILKETGKKVTITDIVLLATTKALMKHPYVNASLDGDNIILHDYVNLAVAVGLDEGLLTPVIKNAHKMTLTEMVIAAKDIQERTMKMKLSPDELQGSTFTVSSLGMFGISHFNPIINQPNSAILGVNAITEKVVPIDGEIKIKPMMTLSLTLDHRVIDGVIGAKFLQEMKYLLENPMTMLI